MYRVFESLDELVTIVEEARGLPMTSGCVVPRGDVLELLDEVRHAIPAELDDAQDVLDHRDDVVGKAEQQAKQTVHDATAEAEQIIAEAKQRAEHLVAGARTEAERTVDAGQREYDQLVERARAEAERTEAAARDAYDRAVEEGRAEQARLVADTEIVQAAHAESARIIDSANAEADQLRDECDAYVDGKLADFEDVLDRTLRTVSKGRGQLRTPLASGNGRAGRDGHDRGPDRLARR